MRYVISDIHGEYRLFLRLMDKISFSDGDELYVLGDIIEKGPQSVRLLKHIFSMPNAHVIMGNHEDAFTEYYHSLMRGRDGDYGTVIKKLQEYLGGDGELLDWELVDRIETLPYYIENEDFICVHAGVPLDERGKIPPLASIDKNELTCSRTFKRPDAIPVGEKCVFFGHTATSAICGEDKILIYRKRDSPFTDIRGYAKIHLDTCTFVSGTLGCFCVDTCEAHYVSGVKRNGVFT